MGRRDLRAADAPAGGRLRRSGSAGGWCLEQNDPYQYLMKNLPLKARLRGTRIRQGRDKGQRYGAQGRSTDGARRSTPLLAQAGLRVSRRRLGRRLTPAGWRCTTRRRCQAPTPSHPPIPPQRQRDLTGHAPARGDVADMPSLPPGAGWWSLAVVLDLCSRAVVGGAMADPMRAELVPQA